jgi:tetratricopeptide (TPR) repeat protein
MTASTDSPNHPSREDLTTFLTREGSRDRDAVVERHLRAGCLPCLLQGRELVRDEGPERTRGLANSVLARGSDWDDSALGAYVHQIERKALLVEVEEALVEGLSAELMVRAPAARRQAVRETRRYQLLGLSEALRQKSRKEIFRDLARALELADLSAEIADCLDTSFYGSRTVADARALGWAMVANGRRLAGDFFGAERTFQSAVAFLDVGTGSPLERAELSSLLASLRAEQSRFKEAIRLLRRAASNYRKLALPREEGSILVQLGHTAYLSGDAARALRFYEGALESLDPEHDRWLRFLAHHNIATCLNASGASADARRYMDEIAPLYDEFAEDRSMQLRRRWMEGRIAAGLGQRHEAIATLTAVQRVFVEQDKAFETAQVMLDLAAVYLEAGELKRVQRLAREMYPVFRSQDIHREAIAALLLFERAVTAETATVALAQDVARYLNRARNNPYIRYEPAQPIES